MKKRLLLIDNSNLIDGQGGVEHVLCNMANVMDDTGMEVFVATMENKEGTPFYHLNDGVKFYNAHKKMNFITNIKKKLTKKKYRYKVDLEYKSNLWEKLINDYKPDVIICFSLPTLLDVTYNKNYSIPIILTVHGNPINDYTNRFWSRPDFMNKLLENAYQKASIIQVLLDSYKESIPKNFRGETITIANIAPYGDYTIDYDKNCNNKIVCIASLDERKHQDLLINAFSTIADKYPDWTLELWGSGYKRKEYEQLTVDNKMQDRILLYGSTKQPKDVMKTADIFALPSTCEGWPLVLGEAMSMGIPCIGLDTCDGVNEIIRHNENGVLAKDDIKDFADKLEILIENKVLRKQFGLQAQNDMKNYTENIIWGKWKELISKCLK